MSERELREASKRLFYACTTQSQRSVEAMVAVNKALAEEPDAVKALRWANERRCLYLKAAECVYLRDEAFYRGKAGMAAELQEYCGKIVRLTETGWEWTDGGEDGQSVD